MPRILSGLVDHRRRRFRAAQVIVPPAAVASVEVSPATPSVTVDATVQLTATPKDADGNALTGRTATWASSDETKATVSSSGLVTGVAEGSATITATCEGAKGTAVLAVTPPVTATIAFVVGTPNSMSAAEQTLADQLASWGYAVRLYDDSNGTSQVQGDEAALVFSDSCAAGPWATPWASLILPFLVLDSGLSSYFDGGETVLLSKRTSFERSQLLTPASSLAAGDVTYATAVVNAVYLTSVSPHAQVVFHVPGDRFSPIGILMARGEPMEGGVIAPARRAFCHLGFAATYDRLNDAAHQIIRELLAWCVADPGDGPVPLFTTSQDYEPDATVFVATDASTVPAGRTIASRTWALLDAAGAALATGSGTSYTTAAMADGFYMLDLTVTDDLGASRTKRMPLYAELVSPLAAFTYTQVDGSPASNTITATDASNDRGVAITTYDWWLYAADGVTLVDQALGGGASYTTPLLADGSYVLRHRVTNADGATDTTADQTIEVPTPLSVQAAEVDPVGFYAYAYCKSEPAVGATITSIAWDFDTDNPGTVTGTGLHPGLGDRDGKPAVAAAGTYNWSCTATQSNGYVWRAAGTWSPYLEKTWGDRGSQDYTTPVPPAPLRSFYVDAAAPDGGDGTAGLPFNKLSDLTSRIQVGDLWYLTGDFRSQGDLAVADLVGDGQATGTTIKAWPSRTKPQLQVIGTAAAYVSGCSYLWLDGMDADGSTAAGSKLRGIYIKASDHIHVINSNGTGGYNFVRVAHSPFCWVSDNTADGIGDDVTLVDHNGGNGIQFEDGSHDYTCVRNAVGNCGHVCIENLLFSGQQMTYRGRIAHNTLHNIWAGSIGIAGGVNCLVEENDIRDIGQSVPVGYIGSKVGINVREDLHTVRYNRTWNSSRSSLQVQSNYSSGKQKTRRNHVYHNTYYHNGFEGQDYQPTMFLSDGDAKVDDLYLEDNLFENECYAECHPYVFNGNGFAIRVLMNAQTDWVVTNLWEAWNQAPAPHFLGNTVRHTNIFESLGLTTYWLTVQHQTNQSLYNNYSLADAASRFAAWAGNLQVDPLFASVDPASPDFLRLQSMAAGDAADSPLLGAGTPVPGITYPGGVVPVGWYPEAA